MPKGSARSGWNKRRPGTLSVPLASSEGLDSRLSVKRGRGGKRGVWVGPPEELRPARRRGKEKIPSREEGPRDLKMRHCCSVVCPSWPLLLPAERSFPASPWALGGRQGRDLATLAAALSISSRTRGAHKCEHGSS